jgi:actinorhodin biosynthesis protein ActVIA
MATSLYVRVQQFYAKQMHLLDANAAEAFAATFVEDGEILHGPGLPPTSGRAALAEAVRAVEKLLDGAVRRHVFSMYDVEQLADGDIRTTYYATIIDTKAGEQPVVSASCLTKDVLVDRDGTLLNRSRQVENDSRR